jgi:beta-lactamase superfamily II metal-dependent hydrolase
LYGEDHGGVRDFFLKFPPHLEVFFMVTDMKKYLLITLLLMALVSIVACISPVPSQNPSNNLYPASGIMTVHFINVWMGESILIQSPSGKTMLIDAGDEAHGKVVSSYLKNLSITSLDVVVNSYPGDAYIGGMTTVLQDFTVKEFIDSGHTFDPRPSSTYTHMRSFIDEKKIPFRTVKAGDTIAFDPAVTVNVLNPQVVISNASGEDSVVLKMTYGNISFLFMSDANGERENTLVQSVGHADILKVGSFGDSGSSGPEFLSHVKPGISVIAAGNLPLYNIPAVETIQNLKQSGSIVYITYLNGTVKVTTDGKTYSASSEK